MSDLYLSVFAAILFSIVGFDSAYNRGKHKMGIWDKSSVETLILGSLFTGACPKDWWLRLPTFCIAGLCITTAFYLGHRIGKQKQWRPGDKLEVIDLFVDRIYKYIQVDLSDSTICHFNFLIKQHQPDDSGKIESLKISKSNKTLFKYQILSAWALQGNEDFEGHIMELDNKLYSQKQAALAWEAVAKHLKKKLLLSKDLRLARKIICKTGQVNLNLLREGKARS